MLGNKARKLYMNGSASQLNWHCEENDDDDEKKVLLEAVVTKVDQAQAENSARVKWYPWKLLLGHHHCKDLPGQNIIIIYPRGVIKTQHTYKKYTGKGCYYL